MQAEERISLVECTTKLQVVTSTSCKLSHIQVECQSLVVSSSDELVVLGIFLISFFYFIYFLSLVLGLIYSFFSLSEDTGSLYVMVRYI